MKFNTCMVLVVLIVGLVPAKAVADEKANERYLSWFTPANAQLRIAATYLRTGNSDFAALALEQLDAVKVPEKLPAKLLKTVSWTKKKSTNALDLIDNNQPQQARSMLLKLRESVFQGNKSAGIMVFDDCIWLLIKRGPALWHFRKNRPDLNSKQQSQKVARAAANYLKQLNKCDSQASERLKKDADFQRLVTGARQSLERIPIEALAQKDGSLLYRFIIELRSFDRLLYFRYG